MSTASDSVAPTLTIAIEAPRQPELVALLEQSTAYAHGLGYPPESHFLLSIEALERPGTTVYVARDESGIALGIAALVVLSPEHDGSQPGDAELKRMYVGENARGRGVAGALLTRIETDAAANGIRRLVLETCELHTSALALYSKHGYAAIAQFGQYIGEQHSLCMAKLINTAG